MNLTKLKETLEKYPRFRFQQCVDVFLNKNSWDEATNLPKNLVDDLEENVPFLTLEEVEVLHSEDGSHKALLKLEDGKLLETVAIPNGEDSYSICLSSQVGCACGCKFCATGTLGFTRDLTAGEFVDQFIFWKKYFPNSKVNRAIVMGMGEPMLNFENVADGLDFLIKNLKVAPTSFAISTVGIIENIKRMHSDDRIKEVKLAVSMHAPTQKLRESIMPVASANQLDDLMKVLDEVPRKVFIEYVLLKDINDTPAHATQLADLLKNPAHYHINLIRYNDTFGQFSFAGDERFAAFHEVLRHRKFDCTRRRSYGEDISGACGQLLAKQK